MDLAHLVRHVRAATVATPINSGTRSANTPVSMPLNQPFGLAAGQNVGRAIGLPHVDHWLPPERMNKASASPTALAAGAA